VTNRAGMNQSRATRRVAGIDVGSNSFLLTILDIAPDGETVVLDRADIIGLSEGVDRTRLIGAAACQRGLEMLSEYQRLCDEHEVQAVKLAGTAVFRDAENPELFLDAVERQCDWRIEIVSGEREAELTYRDVDHTHGDGGPLALLDIGGGSSEIVSGQGGRIDSRRSINIGSRRLTERTRPNEPWTDADLARARELADEAIGPVAPLPGRLVGTGGTITCLAAVAVGMAPFDPAEIAKATFARQQITGLAERLAKLPLDVRAAERGMEPKRADVIVGGAILLERWLHALRAEQIAVASGGLRFALAREAAAHA